MALDLSSALGQDIVDKRIDILQRVDHLGSISKAARSAGISYKAAWQAIETLSTLAGEPVVHKVVGGSDGGGAQLTASGKAILEASATLSKIRNQVLNDLPNGQHRTLATLTSSALRMSVRNIIPCKVLEMKGGLSMEKLTLEVCFGNTLRASITTESAQLLGIHVGLTVLALFKATAASICDHKPPENSTKYLEGIVTRLPQKGRGGEVTLLLPNNISVVGFIKSPHTLTIGTKAYLTIEEDNVIVALLS